MFERIVRRKRVRSLADDVAIYGPISRHDAGVRAIPVACVVGSVGRAHELRADFRPIHVERQIDHDFRYRSIREMLEGGAVLPPIQAYLLDGRYYVIDGNRRVAAARSLGQVAIDAQVVELRPMMPSRLMSRSANEKKGSLPSSGRAGSPAVAATMPCSCSLS